MAYKIILREDGWFDSGKDAPGVAGLLYNSKQTLKQVLLATETAPSLPRLKEKLDCKLEYFNAVALPGFDGRPYLHGKELRIAPSAPMPEYCILGEVVSEEISGK